MGRGIAQVCATAGNEVTVRDVEPDLVVEAVPEEMELKRETVAAVEVVAAEQTAVETVEFAAESVEGVYVWEDGERVATGGDWDER